MEQREEMIQPGFERVHAPDIEEPERFAEALDRSLTSDLDENDDSELDS